MSLVNPTRSLALLAALLSLTLLAGGCTSTKTRRVARFNAVGHVFPVERPAPRSAEYAVKYAGASGHDLRAIPGTRRIIGEGQTVGFETTPDGKLVAIAGEERIKLAGLPADARYCVWCYENEQPTQFTKEVGKATVAVGGGLLVAGLVMVEALPYAIDDDDDDEEEEQCKRRDRRRRGYRWVGAEGK